MKRDVLFWLIVFVAAALPALGAVVCFVATSQAEPPPVVFRYEPCDPATMPNCKPNGLIGPYVYLLLPDMNGDGAITETDLVMILQAIEEYDGRKRAL